MADYTIEITEQQADYEYPLKIVSYKNLQGAIENVDWTCVQADPAVFSNVRFCKLVSQCTDVIQNPDAEFSGDVLGWILHFAFAPGVTNGTYNIFLQQNESLKLLNIQVDRNIVQVSCALFNFPDVNTSNVNYNEGTYPVDCTFTFPEGYSAEFRNRDSGTAWGNSLISVDGGSTWTPISSLSFPTAGTYQILTKPLGVSPLSRYKLTISDGVTSYNGDFSFYYYQSTSWPLGYNTHLMFYEDVNKSDLVLTFSGTSTNYDLRGYKGDDLSTVVRMDGVSVPMSVDLIFEFLAIDEQKTTIAKGSFLRILTGDWKITGGTWKGINIFAS